MTIVTSTSLAAWLGIPDTEDDANLTVAAAATNVAVARYCGRTFETTTSASASARTFTPRSWTICPSDDFHTTDNLVVKIDSNDDGIYESTLTTSDYYVVEPEGQERALGFPYRKLVSTGFSFPTCNQRPSVQITAAWGWSEIPADVTLAGLIKGARLFKRRQSPEGFASGFQDFAARITRSEDPDVVDLLAVYRTPELQLYV